MRSLPLRKRKTGRRLAVTDRIKPITEKWNECQDFFEKQPPQNNCNV